MFVRESLTVFCVFFTNSLSLYVYLSKSSQAQAKKNACSICKRQNFFSRRDLAKHERTCREIEKKQMCQDVFDRVVRKPRTPRVVVARPGKEKESKDVPSCQVSPTDDCCIVDRNHVNLFFSLNSFLFEAEHHTDL